MPSWSNIRLVHLSAGRLVLVLPMQMEIFDAGTTPVFPSNAYDIVRGDLIKFLEGTLHR